MQQQLTSNPAESNLCTDVPKLGAVLLKLGHVP